MSNKINFKSTKEKLSDLSTGQITVSALLGAGLGMAFVSIDDVNELNTLDVDLVSKGFDSKSMDMVDAQVEFTEIADHSSTSMSFGDMFSMERNLQGPGGVFIYNGKLYNTFHKEEWDVLTDSDKGDYLASYDLKHSFDSVSYRSPNSEISIDNDSHAEIVIGDANADGTRDIVEVDLNNDGHIDIIHSTQQKHSPASVNLHEGSVDRNTDVSFDVQSNSEGEVAEFEIPVTYTHEEVSDLDNIVEIDEAISELIIDESSLTSNSIEYGDMIDPSDVAIELESGDMVDPSDVAIELESGDMIDPSDVAIELESGDIVDPSDIAIELESGDMVDPSDVAIELESGDMVDPSDVAIELESGDMVDPSDVAIELESGDMIDPSDVIDDIVEDSIHDLNLDNGSTDLGDDDVTGLDLSEFDF